MIQIKLIYFLIFGLLANNYAIEERQNDEEQVRQTKKFKKGRKALRNKNPELFKQLKDKRKEWKGLSVEEREQARSEWFKQNPEAQSIKKANKANRKWRDKMGKLKQDHPELYEKFKSQKSKWKKLNKQERRAARQAFMKAHPEVKRALQGNKKGDNVIGKLKESNPELAKRFSQARESWKTLQQDQRRQARKQFMRDNPEIRKSLQKFKKNRKKRRNKKGSEDNQEI